VLAEADHRVVDAFEVGEVLPGEGVVDLAGDVGDRLQDAVAAVAVRVLVAYALRERCTTAKTAENRDCSGGVLAGSTVRRLTRMRLGFRWGVPSAMDCPAVDLP